MSHGTHLVLSSQESNFSSTDSNVARRHVSGWAEVPVQLGHERLTEATDLAVALSLGIKVRSTLAATHGKTRKGVLEDLLKAQELENIFGDSGMKPQSSLVWSENTRRVEASVNSARGGINPLQSNLPGKLHTPSFIQLKDAVVVFPRNSEANGPLRFGQDHKGTFVKLALLGILKERQDIQGHFFHRLNEGWLIGVLGAQVIEEREIWVVGTHG